MYVFWDVYGTSLDLALTSLILEPKNNKKQKNKKTRELSLSRGVFLLFFWAVYWAMLLVAVVSIKFRGGGGAGGGEETRTTISQNRTTTPHVLGVVLRALAPWSPRVADARGVPDNQHRPTRAFTRHRSF